MLTNEQIQQRLNFVTGTDASTILGVNPYESILDLYLYKTGFKTAPDISDKPAVKMGNILEPVVCQLFTDATGIELAEHNELIIHSEHNWMAGNIDRKVKNEKAIFEAKTASYAHGWGEQGENIIPKHYLCQITHYMAVCDVVCCYVGVLIGGVDFRHYTIHRSTTLEKILIEKEHEFWHENVLKQIMPEPRTYDDIIIKYQNETLAKSVVATGEISKDIDNYRMCKQLIKEHSERIEELRDRIARFMGQHETLIDVNGQPAITWKPTKDSFRFDANAFKNEHPDLYAQYIKMSAGQRRFLLKGEKP